MKKLLGLLILIVSLNATAQYSPNPHNYGTQGDRLIIYKALHVPEKDTLSIDDNVDSAQVFWDLGTHQFIVRAEGAYHVFSGGTPLDTTSLSDRINNCVLIANLPTILTPYLLSSSFDSMATALGYLKAAIQNSQLAHSSIFFANSPGLVWGSSGVGALGNNITAATDSNYLSTVNRLLDSIISVKALIGAGHSDTTLRGKVIPALTVTVGFLKYSTSCNCWSFDSTVYAANSAVVHNTGTETIAGTKTFSSTIIGTTNGNVPNSQRITDSTAQAAINAGKVNKADSSNVGPGGYATPTQLNNKQNIITVLPVANGGTGTSSPALVPGTNITISGTWPNQTINSSGGGSGTLNNNYIIPTSVKTANYRLLPHDYAIDSLIGTNIIDTLPLNAPDSTVVGSKSISRTATETVTFLCSGTDVINNLGGSATLVMTTPNEGLILQYKAAKKVWYVTTHEYASSSLAKSTLNAGHFLIGNISGIATDTPFVNDLVAMPQIKTYVPAIGIGASDTINHYGYYNIDSIPSAITNATGSTVYNGYGGWLSNSSSGGWLYTYTPCISVLMDSYGCGHPWDSSGYEKGNWRIPDAYGQIGYRITQNTNIPVYDMSKTGETSTKILSRFPRDGLGIPSDNNDGFGVTTIPHKPIVVVIGTFVNDPFNGINFQTTKWNITLMCEMAFQAGVPVIIINSPGQGNKVADSAQLKQITDLNNWYKTGALTQWNVTIIDLNSEWNSDIYGGISPYINDNQHYSAFVNGADGIHAASKAAYDTLGANVCFYGKIPRLTKMVFTSVLDPVNPPSNYARPTGITIGSTAYTLNNNPYDTIAITAPLPGFDSATKITITSSITINGAGTISGWGPISYYLDNNPTNQIWYTQRSNFKGFPSDIQLSSATFRQPSYATTDSVTGKFNNSTGGNAWGLYTTNAGAYGIINGNAGASNNNRQPNIAWTIYNGSNPIGIWTDCGLQAGKQSILNQFQIGGTASAGTTGYGVNVFDNAAVFETNNNGFIFAKWPAGATNLDPSVIGEFRSATKGVLLPRYTTSSLVSSISSPIKDLLAIDSLLNKIKLFNGSLWNPLLDSLSIKGSSTINASSANGGIFTFSTINTPTIVASNYLSAQTAAQTISTYTTGTADSSYSVAAGIDITALSANIVTTIVTYTDETNTSRTVTLFPMGSTSSTLTTGPSNYSPLSEIRVKASTTITLAIAVTGAGSQTYNAWGSITKLHN